MKKNHEINIERREQYKSGFHFHGLKKISAGKTADSADFFLGILLLFIYTEVISMLYTKIARR